MFHVHAPSNSSFAFASLGLPSQGITASDAAAPSVIPLKRQMSEIESRSLSTPLNGGGSATIHKSRIGRRPPHHQAPVTARGL